MSECRAVTNMIGNAVATIVIARWERAIDDATLQAALRGEPLPTAPPDAGAATRAPSEFPPTAINVDRVA
jgi:aerobic C4-dicarboxylate transport protein